MTLTTDQILAKLAAHGNKIFSIKFRRRRDKVVNGAVIARAGDVREMRCRLHVVKGVKGVQPHRSSQDRQSRVITVFEMGGLEGSGFKCIPLDGIVEINGESVEQE